MLVPKSGLIEQFEELVKPLYDQKRSLIKMSYLNEENSIGHAEPILDLTGNKKYLENDYIIKNTRQL